MDLNVGNTDTGKSRTGIMVFETPVYQEEKLTVDPFAEVPLLERRADAKWGAEPAYRGRRPAAVIGQTLQGSFSAVSKPNFASK